MLVASWFCTAGCFELHANVGMLTSYLITKVITIHPLGTTNVWTKFGNPSKSCQDISLKTSRHTNISILWTMRQSVSRNSVAVTLDKPQTSVWTVFIYTTLYHEIVSIKTVDRVFRDVPLWSQQALEGSLMTFLNDFCRNSADFLEGISHNSWCSNGKNDSKGNLNNQYCEHRRRNSIHLSRNLS